MRPTQHASNNDVLQAPPQTPHDECQSLPITRVRFENGMPGCWSYWKPSAEERALIAIGKPVRLSVIGLTHPPIAVGVEGDGLDL